MRRLLRGNRPGGRIFAGLLFGPALAGVVVAAVAFRGARGDDGASETPHYSRSW